jgi:hypothetical protein
VAFAFVLMCEIVDKVDVSPFAAAAIVYVSLVLLTVVIVVCLARIWVERKFRIRLEDQPDLLKGDPK